MRLPLLGRVATVGILSVGLAFIFVQSRSSSSKPSAPAAKPPSAPPADNPPPEESPPPVPESTGVQLIMEAQGQWRLNGIVRGGDGKALALINGRLIEEGGVIEGARVVRVNRDEVELEKDGQRSTLTLP